MVKGPGAEAAEELLDEEGVPGIIDFRFLTTETNLKALYIFLCFLHNLIRSYLDCTDFYLQIFVYNWVFFRKKEKTHETFHTLNMKKHFEKKNFENESSFRNPF